MPIPNIFTVIIFCLVFYLGRNTIDMYFSDLLQRKTVARRYFRGSRDPANYCIQISVNQDTIEVTNTYKTVYEAKKTGFVQQMKNLTGNADAEYFKSVIVDALEAKDGYVNVWYKQNTRYITLHNNKVAPSHKFFLSNELVLDDDIQKSIESVYKNIVTHKETNTKTIKALTYLAFNGFLSEILIVVLKNCVIGYNKGDVFFEVFYDTQKAVNELKDIDVLQRLQIYTEHAFTVMIKENAIVVKALKKNDEIRAIIEMDSDLLGYKNFLNLTYGKKIPKNVYDTIQRAYNKDKKLGDMEIEEAENIYDKVKETLNSKHTRFVSSIYM